jgi:hypothetical protein
LLLSFREDELLDAGEEIQRLLDLDGEDAPLPPLRRILLALDDAITAAHDATRE